MQFERTTSSVTMGSCLMSTLLSASLAIVPVAVLIVVGELPTMVTVFTSSHEPLKLSVSVPFPGLPLVLLSLPLLMSGLLSGDPFPFAARSDTMTLGGDVGCVRVCVCSGCCR